MAEERLEGGNVGGAVRAGATVRRPAGPWTPAVHALLAHLADEGFTGAPSIAHNDAATYNAAWHQGTLTGFFDWDFAGPATPEWDLAFAAFSWVPLHTRDIVAAEGFTDFAPSGSW
jgi:aminoglycoside phosphotransferase (APT) family kinase protein